MTVGAIITCLILTVVIVLFGGIIAYGAYDMGNSIIGTIISVFVTFIVTATLWGGTVWYYHNTEAGARALKTQDSNFNGGIERQVIVYDANGDVIEEYQGKFDVEYDSNQILFDDENGQRHIICFGSGTVIINEL